MAENFKAFIDSFNKQLDEAIAKTTTKVDSYRSAREAAIKLNDPIDLKIGGDSFKTIGELFAWVYPNKDGGVQNIPSGEIGNQILAIFAGKEASAEVKKNYDLLRKNWNSANKLARESEAKKSGAENWVDSFKSTFYKQLSASNLKVSEIKAEDFEDMLSTLGIDVLYGNTDLLYEAIKSSSEEKSQINETEEKKTPAPVASQINESMSTPAKMEESSAINPEETAKVKPEEVKKTESTVVGTTAEVPKEEVTPAAPININLETKAEKKEESTVQPAASAPSTSTTSTSSESTTVSSEKTTIVEQPAVTQKPVTSNPVNAAESKVKSVLTEFFGGKGGLSEAQINDVQKGLVSNAESEINKESISSTSTTINDKSSELSTINEKSSDLSNTVTSEINKTASTINEKTNAVESTINKTKEQIAAEEKYIRSFLGMEEPSASGTKTKSEAKIEATSQPSEITAEKSSQVEVTKAAPSFSEKIAPNAPVTGSAASVSPAPTAPTESVTMTEVKSESAPTSPEAMSQPAESTAAASPQASASPGIDISALEYRLSRLEYLLSSPLEVKIVE